jgi:hypothetical protein
VKDNTTKYFEERTRKQLIEIFVMGSFVVLLLVLAYIFSFDSHFKIQKGVPVNLDERGKIKKIHNLDFHEDDFRF